MDLAKLHKQIRILLRSLLQLLRGSLQGVKMLRFSFIAIIQPTKPILMILFKIYLLNRYQNLRTIQ